MQLLRRLSRCASAVILVPLMAGSLVVPVGARPGPPLPSGGPAVGPASPDAPWAIETVEMYKQFYSSPGSLALDGAGRPHVAYGGNHLYYAWHDGTAWQQEIVDLTRDVGWAPAIALDAAGRPHISYTDASSPGYALKYAWYDGAAWQLEVVDATLGSGYSGLSDLALDSSGRPHIAYYADLDEGEMRYAWHDGAAWHYATLDLQVGLYWEHAPSLALDAAGHPHIGYLGQYRELRYASYDGAAWHTAVVDTLYDMGPYPSLALDSQGQPRICYAGQYAGGLRYAQYNGSAWQLSTVTDAGSWECSLALDAAGRPRISYYDGSGNLWYASYDGAAWQTEFVDHEGWTASLSSLALDGEGQPQVTYFVYSPNSYSGELRRAQHDGTAWQIETIDRTAWVGQGNSLAVDSAGRPHISYLETGDEEQTIVKYARHDGAAWQIEEIDAGRVIWGTSLALDALDRPHIAYGQDSVAGLLYARFDGTAWHTETVEPVLVGGSPALALDAADRPGIAYHDNGDGTLRYARYDGAAWQVSIVAGGLGAGGGALSLALDAAGRPAISFFDSASALLKYAFYDGTAWQVEVVDAIAYMAGYNSLRLDAAGRPHISYYDYTAYDLRYASYDGTAWQIETVADFVQGYNALALGLGGQPHIVFYDAASSALQHTWYDGIAWQVETVDPGPPISSGNLSLVADASGRLHLSCSIDGMQYAVTVLPCQPMQQLAIAGPPRLPVPFPGLYAASYSPPTATYPLVTWDNGAIGRTAAYSWTVPGTYTLTATAVNGCSEVSSTFAVEAFCQPVTATEVSGPARWPLGLPALYAATYAPLTASLPLTLTWGSGAAGPAASYAWAATGTYTVAVTATNACSQGGDSLAVEVFCQEPASAAVSGRLAVLVSQTVAYQVLVEPITVSRPLTYTWDNGVLGPSAAYSWTVPGSYTVSVVAGNPCGQVTGTMAVRVLLEWPYRRFLPMMPSPLYVPKE